MSNLIPNLAKRIMANNITMSNPVIPRVYYELKIEQDPKLRLLVLLQRFNIECCPEYDPDFFPYDPDFCRLETRHVSPYGNLQVPFQYILTIG